jgi:hypothetical protein
MTRGRRFFGLLMLVAAPIVILIGYSNVPSGSACNTINSVQGNWGSPQPVRPFRHLGISWWRESCWSPGC